MKNSILYLFILSGVIFFSCDDYLDVQPLGTVIPKEVADYRALLDNVYAMRRAACSNTMYGSDDMYVPVGQEGPFGLLRRTGDIDKKIYTWADYITEVEETNDRDWQPMYQQLYICNTVINQIDVATGGSEDQKNILRGEALVQRAYTYFFLVNLYGKQYDSKTADTDMGVPILTKPVLIGSLKRASVQEVYDLIFSDLEEGLKLLPETSSYNTRPNKMAVYALLARANLFIGNYKKARTYADLVLKTNNFLYHLADFPKRTNHTVIFPPFLENKELILYKVVDGNTNGGRFSPSPELLSLYKPGDLRRTARFHSFKLVDSNNLDIPVVSDRDPYYSGAPTTAEMYLIRAEANVRMSKIQEAINDINELRKYRFDSAVDSKLTATTAQEALRLVLEERRRELAFLGFRWFDLKRLMKTGDFNKTITHVFLKETYTLQPYSNRYVLPIPQKIIELNPEIEQNPR
ncbi:MAG: RagB/SusD family nutrient uptake outer membrane protein [Flavobacteriaceae bacterium]|nr:MAG: RagB/SusD family nutrient uptake outer membrane protein [Flavobacteriaceae bacterium]